MMELKPCPFCGHSGIVNDDAPGTFGESLIRYGAKCSLCGASFWHPDIAKEEDSGIDWNTRPIEDAERRAREEAERENRELKTVAMNVLADSIAVRKAIDEDPTNPPKRHTPAVLDRTINALRRALNGEHVDCPDCRELRGVVEAARSLYDNRLGWSDGRAPYAPVDFWDRLGTALSTSPPYQCPDCKEREFQLADQHDQLMGQMIELRAEKDKQIAERDAEIAALRAKVAGVERLVQDASDALINMNGDVIFPPEWTEPIREALSILSTEDEAIEVVEGRVSVVGKTTMHYQFTAPCDLPEGKYVAAIVSRSTGEKK